MLGKDSDQSAYYVLYDQSLRWVLFGLKKKDPVIFQVGSMYSNHTSRMFPLDTYHKIYFLTM